MSGVQSAIVFVGIFCTYWLYCEVKLKSARGVLLFIASLLLAATFFLEGIVGLLLLCAAEVMVVVDRFLSRRKRHIENIEREFSGVFLLVIPFFVMLSSKSGISDSILSILILVFFFLRLLKWPQKLPFEALERSRFHNDFIFFWCNAAVLYLCRDMILENHMIVFVFGALMNSMVGFSAGAYFMLIALFSSGFIPSAAVIGPIGLLLSLGRRGCGLASIFLAVVLASDFSAADNNYYIMLSAMGFALLYMALIADESNSNWSARKSFAVISTVVVSGFLLFLEFRQEILIIGQERWLAATGIASVLLLVGYLPAFLSRTVDQVQWDWQGRLFQYITKIDAPVAKNTVELPKADIVDIDGKPPGTLGQYLLWMFVLVFFLLLGGQT